MASERLQRQIDRLLDEAEKAIAQRDWATVQERAQDVVAIDPENQEGQAFLAAAQRALGGSAPQPTSQPATSTPSTSAPTPEHPISFANGRYEVKRFLGEGGKKKVYLAHDTTLDRDVAFALIKTEGLSQDKGSGHIFISHVEEDSSIALQIAGALEAKGYSTWYYERDSVPGPAYLAQMGDAIEQAQAVVLIISPQSVGSNQVTTEVVRAHETNKAFIPLLNGISHAEFQTRAPVWRQALGASTSVEVSEENIVDVAGRIIEGLEALGIRPDAMGSEAERSRITREAQAMGRLGSHPNIVTVFDLGQHEGQPYMVTELMDGGDVEGVIEKADGHRLPVEQAINIAKETCRGLEFAHSRGIIHRDLKPSNVWLTSDGVAKIGDFGLAVAVDRSRLTQEGMMVGTVSYMPPEQAMGGEVSPRMDLYSLGAMLYEMVTGRPPFLGDDSIAIIGQHINTPPVAPTWHNQECPRALEALILRLLAKDPSERPESAADVLAGLQAMDLSASEEVVTVDEAHALDSLAGGVFVGRQQEMGELKAALEGTLSGRGRLVTLVGEPGIGKTRTAQELATYAGLRGAQVLWGRSYEGQGAPPYWPWVQAIRSYVRERDPEQLRSEMGAGAADIAEIVSDVTEQLPGLQAPPQLEPDQARFRLFDSITAFFKSAGLRRPLVLILEDLQWADQPSLLLLEFVARELAGSRLLLIGTYRDVEISRHHPLYQTLGELTRESAGGGFQRVVLRGLGQEDVGRFIELVSGFAPPRAMVEAVHRQTEGNPLFVTEVVRLLAQEGELAAASERGERRSGDSESWNVRIPEGVREVIGRRLDHLTERCNQTLTIASVMGREFTLEQLKPLIEDLTEDRLLEVLEEALGARVIEELPRVAGRYQFTHALIQDTLAEELSTTRRVRLHARIAEAWEELYGAEAENHAAALAYHLAAVGSVASIPKLVHYSLVAGERALGNYAYEEALDHFERGLAAKEGQEVDAESAALLFGLARSKAATGQSDQLQDAWSDLSRAFDYYEETSNLPQITAVAVYPFPLEAGVGAIGAAELTGRALSLVPSDSHDAALLQFRYATALGLMEGDYEGAQQAFARALETAQRVGDLALEMGTLASASGVDWFHLHWQEAADKSSRAIELAQQVDEPVHQRVAHLWGINSQAALGRLEEARSHAKAMLLVAERLRQGSEVALAHALNARVCQLAGEWEATRDFSEKCLTLSPLHTQALVVRIALEYETGDGTEGGVYLERLIEAVRRAGPGPNLPRAWLAAVIPLTARINGDASRLDQAESEAKTVVSSPSATPFATFLARMGLALKAVVKNDAEGAREQYGALEGQRGTVLFLSADRLLGLLAQTMGQTEVALTHFEEALGLCRRAGYRPELAWTGCDYADVLRERDADGDRAKAITLLDESLALSQELGMRTLMERVLSRRDNLTA